MGKAGVQAQFSQFLSFTSLLGGYRQNFDVKALVATVITEVIRHLPVIVFIIIDDYRIHEHGGDFFAVWGGIVSYVVKNLV